MAIKPILFNTEMVRAILDGRKACTRRILKGGIPFDEKAEYWNVLKKGEWSGPICVEDFIKQFSPYKPGDILYVRETFIQAAAHTFWYKADDKSWMSEGLHWKPAIHMPKEAARIWLKVTDVRVERLQEITEDGAKAEGAIDNRGGVFTVRRMNMIAYIQPESILLKSGTAPSKNLTLTAMDGRPILTYG